MRQVCLAAIMVCLVALAPHPVQASQNHCLNGDGQARIKACTTLIESGEISGPEKLALAYYSRGAGHHSAGKIKAAAADYSKAIQLNPALPEAYNGRGYAWLQSGNARAAVADFRRARKHAPKAAHILHSLGEGYYHMGRIKRARKAWRDACDLAESETISKWQTSLAKQKHYRMRVDGICGSGTIAAFQSCAAAGCAF